MLALDALLSAFARQCVCDTTALLSRQLIKLFLSPSRELWEVVGGLVSVTASLIKYKHQVCAITLQRTPHCSPPRGNRETGDLAETGCKILHKLVEPTQSYTEV